MKSWSPENYAALAKRILNSYPSARFLLVGGEQEVAAGKILQAALPEDNLLNVIGALSFRQTIAFMSLCRFYVGNDTSCMHIAVALKLPILAAFCYPADLPHRDSIIEMYFLYQVAAVAVQSAHALSECKSGGTPRDRTFGCIQRFPHCITQITVEQMWQGWQKLLKQLQEN